jgi:hypothetical protein
LQFVRPDLPQSRCAAQPNMSVRVVPLQILEGLDDARY